MYLSLYRKRRPLTFGDMMGQEHITRTLSNALSSGRLAHAYLFCGPRGTGKTTAAKILARAMNCERYPVSEPCGQCIPCKNIASGVSIDVIEMDAASNRGIDEIRELRERSRFASGESRYKVYIIDEAHMLTPEACNAFLKTLEEPPQNVVFILATTDPSRLPSTIVSRCQRFDFHLLTVDQIRQRLEQILEQEKWQADNEAITLIARLADGSLRDALGILEQCSAYGEEKIDADQVRIVTGATRTDTIEALVKAALDNDLDSGLAVLEQVVFSGRDLNLFMRDLTFVFTRLILEGGDTKNIPSDLYGFEALITRYRGKIEKYLLLDSVELLHEVSGELRHAHFPQYILEVAFIRLLRLLHGRLKRTSMLHAQQLISPGKDTVEAEQGYESHGKPVLQEKTTAEKPAGWETAGNEDKNLTAEGAGEQKPEENLAQDQLAMLQEAWPGLLQEIKRKQKSTAAWLEPAVLTECRGHRVRLAYTQEYTIHQIRIMEENHRKIAEEILSAFFQAPITIKAEIVDGKSKEEPPQRPVAPEPEPKKQEPKTEKKKKLNVEEAMDIFGGKLIDSD
ncbi:MAG: DNA polymerase III subunit gamma/tau [Bacillota bacterium]